MKKIIEINGVKHQYIQAHKKSLLLVYPGVGYTSDKPLLYYGIQCALQHDYDVCVFSYGQIPFDKQHPMDYVNEAVKQVQAMLHQIDVSQYDKVVCLGKSIGTIIAYETTQAMTCQYFMLTPLKEVLQFRISKNDIFICGDNDSLVPQVDVFQDCDAQVHIVKGNHSLECGSVQEDLQQLQLIVQQFEAWIEK